MKVLILIAALSLASIAEAREKVLAWRDNSDNEDGVYVMQRIGPGSAAWLMLMATEPNQTTVRVQVPADGVRRCFRILAFNGQGDASPTNTACTREKP